ncbi:HAE1 family hydrophobic/amphiphilic exporter-1 [Pullulanibacillus pueri]|uniref:Swarming motility protein SwrC n=1 Tax=Pullulanibacillus pueri TaxID=1437324 RepID=A0A8J3ELB3_9BACL|nr:efflux RND transporter permease subunit [Pullulanibacillus pueri]MBM7680309.1 HAE1 family hydrophobic/amphiphilic exporter-1 [Pullulanibacillus pueri]GGH75725.1 swarming motility protein SwrC [Pullulanibacillus pueri]
MRRIIQFSLNNKFALWLLTLIVVVAGIYSAVNMKMETLPNITTPVMTVSTTDPGATPEEVDEQVTQPIEQAVQNIQGVKTVSSNSNSNFSSVQVEFNYETDLDKAETKIKEAISKVSFPENVEDPSVTRISIDAFPIITLSLSNPDQSLSELTDTINNKVVPNLQGIDGVSSVDVSGQTVNEVDLSFKQDQLKKYGLDEQTVENIIQGDNVSYPLGLYNFNDSQKSVVVGKKFTSLDDLKKLSIPSQATGSIVKLGDLATIKMVGKSDSISRTNGEPSIAVQVVKSSDANTVEVGDAVNDEIDKVKKDIPGLHAVTTLDQAQPIKDSVKSMVEKAVLGAIFAMIIILLFLRNFKSTLISVVSIPLSLLIGIIILKEMDITLNIMTLGAMTIAIGRVVDDSIVVIENIYRRMSLSTEKLTGRELITSATREMFMPIMSSTIVTIAVFLPMGFVTGMIGELFLPFALTIVFSLLASLLVAITIVPMLAHSFFKKGLKEKAKHNDNKPGKLANFYKTVLNWTLNHKWMTSIIAIVLLVGSLGLVPFIGVSFIGSDEQKMVVATYSPDPGQTLDDVKKVGSKVEDYFSHRKNVDTIQYSVGGGNPMSMGQGQDNSALFYVQYDEDTPNFSTEQDKVMAHLKKMTNKGEWGTINLSTSGSSNNLTVNVFGDNIDQIKPVINKIQGIMKDNSDLKNVDSTLSKNYVEYTLDVDQEKLAQLGLTTAQIGASLGQKNQQKVITTIKKGNEDVNVYLQSDNESYNSINDLTKNTIQSPTGQAVKISDVTHVKKGQTSDSISRKDGDIYASVSGEITSDDVSKVSAAVQKQLDKIDLPSGVKASMGGVTEDINSSFTQLGLAMLAAIAIVYLILVITFGSALAPLAILFSLPFVIIGAFLGLFVTGETISISVMIGALMLIGIVITNAIVLIDRVIRKEKEGLSTRDAILEAGAIRLRPILMTAIATICALLPLAIGLEGSGGLISKDLGISVIGGLTSSTLLTLIIVPLVYELFMRRRNRKKLNKK